MLQKIVEYCEVAKRNLDVKEMEEQTVMRRSLFLHQMRKRENNKADEKQEAPGSDKIPVKLLK